MPTARKALCGIYVAVGVVALVACWRQNLAFAGERGISVAQAFVDFWPALLANPATTSITLDIFLFGLAAFVWMVLEARRLGIRFVWAYLIFGLLIAISFTFPLFLVARERKLHELGVERSAVTLTTADVIGLLALGGPIVVGAIASLFW